MFLVSTIGITTTTTWTTWTPMTTTTTTTIFLCCDSIEIYLVIYQIWQDQFIFQWDRDKTKVLVLWALNSKSLLLNVCRQYVRTYSWQTRPTACCSWPRPWCRTSPLGWCGWWGPSWSPLATFCSGSGIIWSTRTCSSSRSGCLLLKMVLRKMTRRKRWRKQAMVWRQRWIMFTCPWLSLFTGIRQSSGQIYKLECNGIISESRLWFGMSAVIALGSN